MSRAFPVSLFLHLVVLSLIVIFGSHVARQTLPRHRTISVHVTPAPRMQPDQAEPDPVVQETPPVVEEQKPEPVVQETKPEEPKIVPEAKPQETQVETPAEEPEPVREEPKPEATVQDAPPAETPAPAPPKGSKVGTDVSIPAQFQYWIDLLETRVAMNWYPKQLGFRRSTRVCKVHFNVERNGMITRETIVESSGVPLMDRESLKAVKAVGRFLPIPAGLGDNALGVTYIFTLTSGN